MRKPKERLFCCGMPFWGIQTGLGESVNTGLAFFCGRGKWSCWKVWCLDSTMQGSVMPCLWRGFIPSSTWLHTPLGVCQKQSVLPPWFCWLAQIPLNWLLGYLVKCFLFLAVFTIKNLQKVFVLGIDRSHKARHIPIQHTEYQWISKMRTFNVTLQ